MHSSVIRENVPIVGYRGGMQSFAIGAFVVRLQTRVPFEREPAFVGVAWSAGLAVMWF